MDMRVDAIRLGKTSCLLLRGDGAALVDTGIPGKGWTFARALARPQEIARHGPADGANAPCGVPRRQTS